MAESYVTKFTKYVSKQRDALEGKLKSKGIFTLNTDPLEGLIGKLDELQESFGLDTKYQRDENFPDFDEMFDNDPLRAVNGGEYKACAYILQQLSTTNTIEPYFQAISTSNNKRTCNGYYGEKVIISDGAEYVEQSGTSFKHTVAENGVYTDKNGFRFALVKIYATEPCVASNNVYFRNGFREIIDDYFIGYGAMVVNSPYVTGNSQFEYFRWVGSNVTPLNMYDTSYWYVPPYFSGGVVTSDRQEWVTSFKYCRIDGIHRFINLWTSWHTVPNGEKMEVNGTLYPNTSADTTVSCVFGNDASRGNAAQFSIMDYFRTPNSSVPMRFVLSGKVRKLYCTDNVYELSMNYTSNSSLYAMPVSVLEELHLGSGLKAALATADPLFYNLKHVTVSDGAFGENESAITVSFARATKLTRESVLNIFNGVADRTGKTANILKLSTFTKSLMTDEEKAILTNKNWTLS